jgi:hypothetical protein
MSEFDTWLEGLSLEQVAGVYNQWQLGYLDSQVAQHALGLTPDEIDLSIHTAFTEKYADKFLDI